MPYPFLARERRSAALAAALCACGGGGDPPSTREALDAATATEWTGVRDAPAASLDAGRLAGVRGTWVLHVGDSFVGGPLAAALGVRLEAAGAHEAPVAKDSTSTYSWAEDPELDLWLARRPSLVLVTLGANEVDLPSPGARANDIHTVARKVGAVAPCVWIAPTLWKDEGQAWLQILHDHCEPCLFFDSDAVLGGLRSDERRPDGVHPNDRGGERWAEALWGWLGEHRDPARRGWQLLPYVAR